MQSSWPQTEEQEGGGTSSWVGGVERVEPKGEEVGLIYQLFVVEEVGCDSCQTKENQQTDDKQRLQKETQSHNIILYAKIFMR